MVDSALFVGMSGAQQAMRTLQVLSNNLANTNTVGFRADYELVKTQSATGDVNPNETRFYSGVDKTYSDFKSGPMIETGEALDIAINGTGFIAVQTKEGKEAYTRAGNLQLTKDGFVVTARGDLVLGSAGVINIPPAQKISIGETGTISAQLLTESENELTELGSIKLVDIPYDKLQKGEDGLFHLTEESAVKASTSVRLYTGFLEGSNVDPVKALVDLIDITRQFEIHSKMISTVDDNAKKSNQLLNITE
jgi:flagellar basal-body rod protein FlgF